jgi:hypothetical protein
MSADPELILCHILEIEFVEMRKMTVPAPDREVPGTHDDIMRTGEMAVPARSVLHQFPDRIFPDFCQVASCIHILDSGNEDPGRPAIVAGHLGLVGDCLYNLVCNFFAMVAVCTVFCEDEPVAHGRYWRRAGSLTCCPREAGSGSMIPADQCRRVYRFPLIPFSLDRVQDVTVFLKRAPGSAHMRRFFLLKENSGLLLKKKCELWSKFNYQVKSIY